MEGPRAGRAPRAWEAPGLPWPALRRVPAGGPRLRLARQGRAGQGSAVPLEGAPIPKLCALSERQCWAGQGKAGQGKAGQGKAGLGWAGSAALGPLPGMEFGAGLRMGRAGRLRDVW